MKNSGIRLVALMHAMVLMVFVALASAGAQAHVPVKPGVNAAHGVAFDKHPHEFDCAMPAKGQHLYCHHASPYPQATGPTPLDDDQPALIAHSASPSTSTTVMDSALAAIDSSITGPPAYILFGNFRS